MAEAAAKAGGRAATGSGRPAPRRRPATPAARRPGRRHPFSAGFRWVRVLLLAAAVVVGLPLAHAMFGEVAALLGGTTLLGFLIGRWTAPGAA